jgi:hypothetical protein
MLCYRPEHEAYLDLMGSDGRAGKSCSCRL